MTRALLVLAMVAALAACGRAGKLQPAAGQSLPVKPKMALTQPSAEDLLKRPPNAKPERLDELLRRSEPRTIDRFDLPPPDGGAAPAAPVEPESPTNQLDAATPQ